MRNIYTIKKIEDNNGYLSITFENGLTMNTTEYGYKNKFKEGEEVVFNSGKNRYPSTIHKL